MPTVPKVDPATLEAMSGGQIQPEPSQMMMAAADMHERGKLITSEQQSGTRTGRIAKLVNWAPRAKGEPSPRSTRSRRSG